MRENVSNVTLLLTLSVCLCLCSFRVQRWIERGGHALFSSSLSLSSYLLAARPDTLLKAKAVEEEEEDDDDDGERGQRKSRLAGCHLFLSRTDVVCQMGVFHH